MDSVASDEPRALEMTSARGDGLLFVVISKNQGLLM